TNAISVTGNYSQSAGTLAMGIGSGTAGELLVSGDAAFTGGTVAVTALSGSNLIAGQSYTIAEVGGSLTTSGLSAAATGFSATLGTGANDQRHQRDGQLQPVGRHLGHGHRQRDGG
ncbi:hypothetical protein, partial [Nitrospirillum amazonense]|uniref:hypothetical protein n=1 Tax=Nitrospirillum amazonense TaxID=28077 RepID=UPI0024122799